MKIIPTIFCIFLYTVSSLYCNTPQRAGVFSFDALSSRDHLTSVFNSINQNISLQNLTLKVQSVDYTIVNFKPQFYYNDNDQVETYVDDFNVNVTAGKMYMGYTFNYSIFSTNLTKGTAMGKVLVDSFYFVKKTTIVDGYFEWNPAFISTIGISLTMTIETSNPKLPDDAKSMFQNIINSRTGEQNKLKSNVLLQLNTLYQQNLRKYLNSEDLINSNNIVYNWKNNNLTYTNLVYNYSLSNIGFKGLKYFFLFELEYFADKCNDLPKQFDPTLGGVQEILGLQFIKQGVFYGLKKGWFNTNLNSAWDHELFQFYMGDVANCIDQAAKFPANTPVTGQCHWDPSVFNLTVGYYSPTSVSVQIPYVCTVKNKDVLIQTISFTASFVIQLILTNSYLDTRINYSGIINVSFNAADSYVVTNEALAGFYVLKTLRSLEGSRTFGAGFPTLFRKFPLLKLNKDYITMYDPSEL